MSWVHHKSSSASQTSQTASLSLVPGAITPSTQKSLMYHPPNSSVQQRTVIAAAVAPPAPTLSRHQSSMPASSIHLIASQSYTSNKTINSATNTTMHANNNPQSLHRQQQQAQRQQTMPLQQTQHPPQSQHLTATAPTPLHNSNNMGITNNSINVQSAYSNQQNPWQATPAHNYFPPAAKMMPQTQPPLTNAAANNNWDQMQQQNYENANNNNMYQQSAALQQWPQQQQQPLQQQQQPPTQSASQHQQTAATTSFDNFYNQLPTSNTLYQQQQQKQMQNSANYFQQQPTLQTSAATNNAVTASNQGNLKSQQNAVSFFDNTNNNNNQSQGDSWGDWDWNDNSTNDNSNLSNDVSQQQQKPALSVQPDTLPQQQLPPPQTQQQAYNANTVADSFNQQANNTWNWGTTAKNEQNVAAANVEKQNSHLNVEQQKESWNWGFNEGEQSQTTQQAAAKTNDNENDNWNWQSLENQQQIAKNGAQNINATSQAINSNHVASPPPPPPPSEFSSIPLVENHNYNTNSFVAPTETLAAPPATGAAPTNIPSTVFVSQAKPVTLPSRQYASPPTGNTPVTETPPLSALMPPQAFQNVEDTIPATVPNSTALPPITTSTTPAVPPPAALPNAAVGNPFKRAGAAQHHRATGLLTTVPTTPTVFNMPPPPPADFANPSTVPLIEPENNEIPLQENQEILASPGETHVPLQQPSSITLPNSAAATLPPPNDERNQYLQTSHLSENSEDQQPEADGLLPPPGLSRLVLGEPELEASQQRLVMGTDAPGVGNTVNVTDVMHLEERHADGEDTASENAVPIVNNIGPGAPTLSSSALTTDRNLYMFPGEGNANNQQQRVVTGVELREQREIEMDGENLEDQHQQQQQQQQHQQQMHQTLSPEARNEPPVEGADGAVDQPLPMPTQAADSTEPAHQHHQTVKPKETEPVSSINDEDDSDERLLNDRNMNQSTAGSSKSRSKYDNERQTSSRRRDKRSYNRYDSDDYNNSAEAEYSSEREERDRRERNDRRRNYREGSVRSDRGGAVEEDEKRNRRQRRDKRDNYYHENEERSRGDRSKRADRQRGYENDSRYETEESTRFDARKDYSRRSMRHPDSERSRRSDKSAEYEDYQRKSGYRSSKRSGDNYESDRRRRGGDDYEKDVERRRRSDKHRDPRYRDDPRYDPREYEEYRKHSSRNARDSDLEKEGGGGQTTRSGRMHHDPRQAAAMYGYPSGGYYDPYTAYYYNQMARTNPQAYAEWYKKYYGQHAVAGGATQAAVPGIPHTADVSLSGATNDGRESVHSGRSSAHNDVKDRYTHAYITQANEYHRHYHQHHHQLHQQHHQQQLAYNQTLNSTLLEEDSLNQSTSLYGVIGGLSSAHSNSNLSQIQGGYYVQPSGGLGTATSAAAMYYARSDYAESRSGGLSIRDPVATEPQRLTPCKFINEHTVVSFGSGILVTVKPKYTSNGNISNIVKLLKFKPNDETRKLFKVFPGPLVKGLTHKKTVIEFCQEQIRLGPMETTLYAKQLISNNSEKYRGSYTLMWNLLILLLKQNGMVVGTDIAELLLKNQQQFPYQIPNSTVNTSIKSKSGSASPVENVIESEKDLNAEIENNDAEKVIENEQESPENSLSKSSDSCSLSEEEITEKFRNYLLYGNVNEALEWATDNNLWGHALFLASKLDRRSHANVMMKFANKLALNDPLQTLYQLMSGRSPSSVTCVQDERWGDWRPHLSMILSNTSQKPELDRKAITTLGDSLFNRGDLYSAHFCYLMAQVGFGRYQESATMETTLQPHLPKLILLGSSHYKQFQDFAHNEAIVMTEIYEYACSLNDEKFSITEFQPYKFLLASRLLDYGFHLKSLMYLEQISVHIARDPSKYENSFINKVYEMADRLKYYDPVLEKTMDDQQQEGQEDNNNTAQQMEEQKWLQSLRLLAQQYKLDYPNPSTGTTAVTNNYEEQPQRPQEPNYNYQQQQIDQQFMEINKQFSELNLRYQNNTTDTTQQQSPVYYNTTETSQQPLMPNVSEQQQQPLVMDPYQSQPQSLQNEQSNDLQQQQQVVNDSGQNDPYHQQQISYIQTDNMQQQQQQNAGYTQNYYDPSQQQQQQQQQPQLQYNDGHVDASNSYDYWSQQQQQTPAYGDENASPTISMPKSKTYDTDDDGTGGNKRQQGGSQKADGNENTKGVTQQQQKNKDSKDSKGNLPSNQNSGWFGGIWNKFSLKPKNQMILPDDKNPAIVWDPEKKKWVNTDGDENQEEAFKPPPKMSDIMPQSQPTTTNPQMPATQQQQIPLMDPQQQQQYVPTTASMPNSAPSPNPMQQQQQQPQQPQMQGPAPAKTPTLQSNMFKMQRNRTLKNAYVDVFNPSGAPVNKAAENILAPALPPAAVPQGGYFVPGSGPTGVNTSQDNNGYPTQQQTQDTPQFYNPNQYGSGAGY